MNHSTVNFTTSAVSENSTTLSSGLLDNVKSGVHCMNVLFGLPIHSYVIWLIITGTESGVASGFFNLNLSVCEIVNCLNSLLTVLYNFTPFSALTIVTYFLVGLAITGRPLFQCLMCIERYLAVIHPVTFLKFKPLRYRLICCTVAWLISFGFCLCSIFTLVSLNFYMYVCISSIQFILFLSIQLFCLGAILRALKQSGPGERRRENEEKNPVKRRAFYLILITTMNMTMIYMPFTISACIYMLTKHYFEEHMSAGIICFILGGFVQPILYLHRAGKLSCLCSP